MIFLRSLSPLQLALRSLSEGGPIPILSSLMRFALYWSFVRSAVIGLIRAARRFFQATPLR